MIVNRFALNGYVYAIEDNGDPNAPRYQVVGPRGSRAYLEPLSDPDVFRVVDVIGKVYGEWSGYLFVRNVTGEIWPETM